MVEQTSINADIVMRDESAPNKKIKGSKQLTQAPVAGKNSVQTLTDWTVVGPLEFKRYILKEMENDKKAEQSKWNQCSACLCELFPAPFEESSVEQIAEVE